jgi:AMP nucleosidase
MSDTGLEIETPLLRAPEFFSDAGAAVTRLEELYTEATQFLIERFSLVAGGAKPTARYRAFYPEIRIAVRSHASQDSRL